MNRTFLIYIFILLLLIAPSKCFAANTILAAVGKEVITSNDLERRYSTFLKMNNATPQSKQEVSDIKLEILYALVNEKIINQEALRLNITVDENEISQAIHHIEQSQNMAKGSLLEKNTQLGISQDFKDQIHNKLILEKILFEVVFPYSNSIVHDAEINEVLIKDHPESVKVKGFLLQYTGENITKVLQKLDSDSLCNVNILTSIAGGRPPIVINSSVSNIKDSRIKQMISSIKNESNLLISHGKNSIEALVLCERTITLAPAVLSQIREQLKNNKLEIHAKHYLTNLRKKRAIDIHVSKAI